MPDTTRITSAPVLRLFLALMFTSNLLCVDSRCRKWSARWEGYSHFALQVTGFRHFPVNVLPQMGWCNKLPCGSERAPRFKPLILLNYQLYILFFVFLVRLCNMPLCFFFLFPFSFGYFPLFNLIWLSEHQFHKKKQKQNTDSMSKFLFFEAVHIFWITRHLPALSLLTSLLLLVDLGD